ncbi:MAG: excinuclease ABC subunit UvrC [Candidatus Odinarchaeia archaeon]
MLSEYKPQDARQLPEKTGIYIFKNKNGEYIYIGKAKNIKKRVLQHLQSKNIKEKQMISEVDKIEFILTPSEVEALILEQNKINSNKPKYNVSYKDDKSYPFIKITSYEDYPRVMIVRKLKRGEDKKAEFIGPFTNKLDLKKTLNYLRSVFPVANCNRAISKLSRKRPCLEYNIKRCPAPCSKPVPPEEYRKNLDYLKMFFKGEGVNLIKILENEMQTAAEKEEFEKAALLRDRLFAIKKIITGRTLKLKGEGNIDFITLKRYLDNALIGVLSVNNEGLVNQNYYSLKINEFNVDEEIYESFIYNYYGNMRNPPSKVVIDLPSEEFKKLLNHSMKIKQQNIEFIGPETEIYEELINLIRDSTKNEFRRFLISKFSRGNILKEFIKELRRLFPEYSFKESNLKIEGFDISNLGGNFAVASKVSFINGLPDRKNYRRYRIKTVENQDDFAMLKEVVKRRFSTQNIKKDGIPDLIVVDGGKGQLNTVLESLKELKLEIPTVSIAKRFEQIYTPKHTSPLDYSFDSNFKILLQYVRDEAHRFAISYHKKLRLKKLTESYLDSIKGVGEKIKKKIHREYPNINFLIADSELNISQKLKISLKLAKKIKEELTEYLK